MRIIYNLLAVAATLSSIFAWEILHRIKFEDGRGVVREKTFYLSPDYIKASWCDAEDFCELHGMKFAAVRSENEQDELFRYFEKNRIYFDYVWTSLRDMNDDNRWTWSEQPTDKLSYILNWNRASKEPDVGKNHTCGHIQYDTRERFTWGDYTCGAKYNFLCEIDEEREMDYAEGCDAGSKITKLNFCH